VELDARNPQALTSLARNQGWLAENDAILHLHKAGEGNMNRVLRAQLQSGSTLVLKQSLPYVAKYPDIPAPIERLDVEANFYDMIRDHEALASCMPGILGYDPTEHILCMQDLGEATDFISLYDIGRDRSLDIGLPDLVNWLSNLHGLPVSKERGAEFANQAMRALNHEHIFIIPLLEHNGVALSEPVALSAEKMRQDGPLSDAAKHLGDIYLGAAPHVSQACLLHGDFYPGSWLAQGEQPSSVMVIDPEFGFYGAPEFDVGVMYAHLIFAGFAPADIERLLEHYSKPRHFSDTLALQFAGMEIIRRLLGVAQLPLTASDTVKQNWLSLARDLVVN
jgi:5-methylthioribose kinase